MYSSLRLHLPYQRRIGRYTIRNPLSLEVLTRSLSSALGWTICSHRTFLLMQRKPYLTLVVSFAAVEALAQSVSAADFQTLEGNVNCIALFNHEEIGSVSTSGADSSLLPSLLNRLSPTPGTFAQSVAKSFVLSADMGHALHPNYTSKHEDNHKPSINGGVVIKTNAKQRYATDAITSFVVKQLIERKGGKVQEYEIRNDMYVDSQCIFIPHAKCQSSGRVAPPSVQCSRKSASRLVMWVVRCCRCILFARQLDRKTSKIT